MENWLHLEAKSSVGRHTHSTGRPQMAVGDSEHHPGEGTRDERERDRAKNSRHQGCFSCRHVVITTTVF